MSNQELEQRARIFLNKAHKALSYAAQQGVMLPRYDCKLILDDIDTASCALQELDNRLGGLRNPNENRRNKS